MAKVHSSNDPSTQLVPLLGVGVMKVVWVLMPNSSTQAHYICILTLCYIHSPGRSRGNKPNVCYLHKLLDVKGQNKNSVRGVKCI